MNTKIFVIDSHGNRVRAQLYGDFEMLIGNDSHAFVITKCAEDDGKVITLRCNGRRIVRMETFDALFTYKGIAHADEATKGRAVMEELIERHGLEWAQSVLRVLAMA